MWNYSVESPLLEGVSTYHKKFERSKTSEFCSHKALVLSIHLKCYILKERDFECSVQIAYRKSIKIVIYEVQIFFMIFVLIKNLVDGVENIQYKQLEVTLNFNIKAKLENNVNELQKEHKD